MIKFSTTLVEVGCVCVRVCWRVCVCFSISVTASTTTTVFTRTQSGSQDARRFMSFLNFCTNKSEVEKVKGGKVEGKNSRNCGKNSQLRKSSHLSLSLLPPLHVCLAQQWASRGGRGQPTCGRGYSEYPQSQYTPHTLTHTPIDTHSVHTVYPSRSHSE